VHRALLQTESGHADPKKPILATSKATCEISR